jgi:putative aldouronate transport system substrate-binding protein
LVIGFISLVSLYLQEGKIVKGATLWTAVLLTGVSFLAGCGGRGSGEHAESAAAGDGDPFGKYSEPVVLTTGLSVDPNEEWPAEDSPVHNQYTRHIEEQINVKVDVSWTASSSDYAQKVNLAISSNSLPDALVVNDMQFNQMVKSGQLADLAQAYNDYASDTMRRMIASSGGKAVENVSYNGKMYGLTSTSDGDFELIWIRKDWMDKLGLSAPKSIDDLRNIAKAFVEKDPGGNGPGKTIGISGPENGGFMYSTFLTSGTNIYGFEPLFSAFGSYPGWWIKDTSGKAAYGSILPETRTALAELARWYKEGLIDPEMGIRQFSAEAVIGGRSGIFSGGWWMGYAMLPDVIRNNPQANFQCYAVPAGTDGIYRPRASSASYTYVVVNKNYAHPEAAIKINNLLIRDESSFDFRKGSIGNFPLRIAMGMLDECSFTLQAFRDILAGRKTIEDFSDEEFRLYKLLKNDLEKIRLVKTEPYDSVDISAWNPAADMSAWQRSYSIMAGWAAYQDSPKEPVYSLTHSLTPAMETRWSNLRALEDETFMKIVMNQAPIEAFDAFVRDWKAQGGDRITGEVQEYIASK